MDLNKFTTQELEILSNMLQDKISFKRDRVGMMRLEGFMNKQQNEINTYELMRVKINNHLGKFGE